MDPELVQALEKFCELAEETTAIHEYPLRDHAGFVRALLTRKSVNHANRFVPTNGGDAHGHSGRD